MNDVDQLPPGGFIEGFPLSREDCEWIPYCPDAEASELESEERKKQAARDELALLVQSGVAPRSGPLKGDRPLGSVLIPASMTTFIHDSPASYGLTHPEIAAQFQQSWDNLSAAIRARSAGGKTGRMMVQRGGNASRPYSNSDPSIHGKGARVVFRSREQITTTYADFERVMHSWRSELAMPRGDSNQELHDARKTRAAINHGVIFLSHLRKWILPVFLHEPGDSEERAQTRAKQFVQAAKRQVHAKFDTERARAFQTIHIPQEIADCSHLFMDEGLPNVWNVVFSLNVNKRRGLKLRLQQHDLEYMAKTLNEFLDSRLNPDNKESLFELRHWVSLEARCAHALKEMST